MYKPEKLRVFANDAATGLWKIMEETLSTRKTGGKRIVALLHNYAYNRSQVQIEAKNSGIHMKNLINSYIYYCDLCTEMQHFSKGCWPPPAAVPFLPSRPCMWAAARHDTKRCNANDAHWLKTIKSERVNG